MNILCFLGLHKWKEEGKDVDDYNTVRIGEMCERCWRKKITIKTLKGKVLRVMEYD